MRYVLLSLLCIFIIGPVEGKDPSLSEADAQTAKNMIEDLSEKVIKIITAKQNGSKSVAEARREFKDLLEDNFAIEKIAKFTLGMYWRQANEAQKKKFIRYFHDLIVETYLGQFDQYSNEKLVVKDVKPSPFGGILVKSEIVRGQNAQANIKIDWSLYKQGSKFQIFDVFINGVSMSITQRNQYISDIQNNRGNIDAFINKIKGTVENLQQGKQVESHLTPTV